MTESELFDRGLQARREVLGAEYVDANLADTDEFMMAFQRVVTEWAWGYAWSRPGLDRKTRSMLNLAILTALGRPDELGIYVKGALATGVSVDEIKEILIHATVYCGTPAGRQAFRAAHEALLAEAACVIRAERLEPRSCLDVTTCRTAQIRQQASSAVRRRICYSRELDILQFSGGDRHTRRTAPRTTTGPWVTTQADTDGRQPPPHSPSSVCADFPGILRPG